MHKKLVGVCMAVVACAVPSAAAAAPALTNEGKPLAPGASITGRGIGEILFTGTFNVRCSSIHLAGIVIENSGASLKLTAPAGSIAMTGTGTSGDCTSFLGSTKWAFPGELCLATVPKTDNMWITGCGTSPVIYTQEITGAGVCQYSAGSITGTYRTNAGATVNVSEQAVKMTESSFACPSEGRLDFDFDLFTTGGGAQLTMS